MFVINAVWSPSQNVLASGSYDGTIKLWNIHDGKLIQTLEQHTNSVTNLSFSYDGTILASKSHDNTVLLWSTKSWDPLVKLEEIFIRWLGS